MGLPHHTGRQPHGLQLLDPPAAAAYSPAAACRHGAGRGRYLSRYLVMCRVASYHSTSGAMPGSKPGQDGIRNILVRQQMLRTGRRTMEVHTSTTYAVNATRCVCVLWGWERTGGVGWGGVRQWIPVHCALLKLPSHCCVQLLGRLSIPTPGATRSIHELRVAYTSWAANGRTTRNLCFMPPEVQIINAIKGKFEVKTDPSPGTVDIRRGGTILNIAAGSGTVLLAASHNSVE